VLGTITPPSNACCAPGTIFGNCATSFLDSEPGMLYPPLDRCSLCLAANGTAATTSTIQATSTPMRWRRSQRSSVSIRFCIGPPLRSACLAVWPASSIGSRRCVRSDTEAIWGMPGLSGVRAIEISARAASAPTLDSTTVPALKPAYLIHGDDHGAVAERRSRLKALAEAGGDAGSVEILSGDSATPEGVALALSTMTFAIGQRVIVADGAERFKDTEVKEHVAPAMAAMPPDTTIAFFAREEGRTKAPAALHDAVKAAKGQIVCEATIKPWELAGWVREQATRLGLSLDAFAAKTLVAQVGERQQRLLRELEKLVLAAEERTEGEGPTKVSAEEIERQAARSTAWRAFSLADALVGGDAGEALRSYLRLRAQGERLSGLVYLMAQRLRDAEAVSVRLQAGEPPAEIKRGLRMPPRAADRFISDVGRTEPERLRAAVCRIADLELDTRGGAPLSGSRTALSSLEEDTLALRAILAVAS
jgi:DNA polymerase III subunit delta